MTRKIALAATVSIVFACGGPDLSKGNSKKFSYTPDDVASQTSNQVDMPSDDSSGDNNATNEDLELCGNGVVDPGEECDGSVADSCAELGFDGGVSACTNCRVDTTACIRLTCGDGVVQEDETCDDGDANGTYDSCTANCSQQGAYCGDGLANGPEDCDGGDISQTCAGLGFDGGELRCAASCGYDTSGCASCGNGVIEEGEICDDGEANGTYGACNATCSGDGERCGDGVRNGGEACDGADLGAATCSSEGFGRGELGCTSTCEFDGGTCSLVPDVGDVIVTEIMQNPNISYDNDGEWFELHNLTGRAFDLAGCRVESDTSSGPEAFDIDTSLPIGPDEYITLARSAKAPFLPDYVYGSVLNLNNSSDYVRLYCPNPEGGADVLVDGVEYDDGLSFPDPDGASMSLAPGAKHGVSNDSGSNWCPSTSSFGVGDLGTPGAPNDPC